MSQTAKKRKTALEPGQHEYRYLPEQALDDEGALHDKLR